MSENHYAEFSECSMKPQEVLEYVSGPIPFRRREKFWSG